MNNKNYRKCVGMMILNNNNEILVAKRIDHPSGYWQMPQGGIDKNEQPEKAVLREMEEEISTNKVKILSSSKKWIKYEIPKETLRKLTWGNLYVGQTQKWFLFRFLGINSDININTQNPEFSDWKWTNHKNLVDNIVPFKKDLYKKVMREFEDFFYL